MKEKSINERFGDLVCAPELEAASLISFRRRFSIYTRDRVKVQERESIINGVLIQCVDEESIDIAGGDGTDETGRATWRLSNFYCRVEGETYGEPISFVATPHGDKPVFLTVRVFMPLLPAPRNDVSVEIRTWDPSGAPAPRVGFSWRCRLLVFKKPVIVD